MLGMISAFLAVYGGVGSKMLFRDRNSHFNFHSSNYYIMCFTVVGSLQMFLTIFVLLSPSLAYAFGTSSSIYPSISSHQARNLPQGIQTIRQIHEGRYIYFDQTGYVLQLIENGKHYFIARPERSGKSLFLNVLEEIFRGCRDVFVGTEIFNSNYDWKTYPVLMFDFSQISSRITGQFEKGLIAELKEMAKTNKISTAGGSPSFQFLLKRLIKGLYEKDRTEIVILVDEYDNPIANRKDSKLAEKNQDIVDDFFATLKSLDRYVKFTFVTGVDKSIIAGIRGANYLRDISTAPEYSMFLEFGKDVAKLRG